MFPGNVSRSRIAFLLVVEVNDARVERNHVAHLVDENLERVFDVQRRAERAGDLIERIDFAMRFLDLIVSDIRTTLTSLINIDFAQLNRRLGRINRGLVLQPESGDLGVKTRQVFDELLDDDGIKVNTGAA